MKVNLISFQDKAVKELRKEFAAALYTYRMRNKTQVISLQAPTGAGKTIIAAALIESVYFGMTLADGTTFDEQPDGTRSEPSRTSQCRPPSRLTATDQSAEIPATTSPGVCASNETNAHSPRSLSS